jgi:regulation of enolase protein 1 (concanavalin A-like superfamily)
MTTDPSTQDLSGHDAQRGLEHRALRNVRGLVDRIQADEMVRQKSQKWLLAGIAIAVAAVSAVVAVVVTKDRGAGHEVMIAPVSKPPAR